MERLEPFGLLLIEYCLPWRDGYLMGEIRVPVTMLAIAAGCLLALIF